MKKQNLKVLLSLLVILLASQFSFGQGSRYSGEYKKSSPIQYVREKNIVIEGLEFGSHSAERSITLYSCENVIIRNCKFHSNPTKQIIYLDDCKNITITDCTFENIRIGLVAHKSESIKFDYNEAFNLQGVDVEPDRPLGTMAHFDKCFGKGNSISYNICENIYGKSNADDIVNVFNSHGTPDSPLLIRGNWFRGGGPSYSGGGIMLGDFGGSYQIAEDNILVDVGQYGIAIAGGHDNTIRNNKIYGRKQNFTNVGIYALNWSPEVSGKSYNITIENNRVNYISKNGDEAGFWFSQEMLPINGNSTNKFDKSLSPSILPEKIIGRARDNANNNNGNNGNNQQNPLPNENNGSNNNSQNNEAGGPSNPSVNDQTNSPITIYVDTFNRICVNVKGRIYRSANISVMNSNGRKIYTQPLIGYHTVVRSKPGKGSYTVSVKNGNETRSQQIIIN